MPRGKKSKLRAHAKRHRDRAQTQDLKDARAATAEEGEATSSSSPDFEGVLSTSTVAVCVPAPPSFPTTTSATAVVSCERSDRGARRHCKKSKNPSQASTAIESSGKVVLAKKSGFLVQYLMSQYNMNEPMRKADMLRIVHKKFRGQFPEILRMASVSLGLLFGLELKEIKTNSPSYTLVAKADDTFIDGSLSSAWRFPTRGILMPLLGVIFLCHNCASEELIWAVLNMWGIYDGKKHFIFGEPRKFITQNLVNEKYLEYLQVPNSDPPRFQFLWGSRAHAETSKMEVLEFLARLCDIPPSSFRCRFEEALRHEEDRARAAAATMAESTSEASGDSRATSSHCSTLSEG